MKTQICYKCGRKFRNLTKEGMCAYCYKAKFGTWAKEFTYEGKLLK